MTSVGNRTSRVSRSKERPLNSLRLAPMATVAQSFGEKTLFFSFYVSKKERA